MILVKLFDKVSPVRLPHPSKALIPILITKFGITKLPVRLLQFIKVPSPILVKLDDKVNPVMEVQLLKAELPRVVIEFGITSEPVMELQSVNAAAPIVFKEVAFVKLMLDNDVQLAKAILPIVVKEVAFIKLILVIKFKNNAMTPIKKTPTIIYYDINSSFL